MSTVRSTSRQMNGKPAGAKNAKRRKDRDLGDQTKSEAVEKEAVGHKAKHNKHGKSAVPTGSDRYYNRELSWLQFNTRVLEEAANPNHPVLERLRFLSISASNLDEFYMVRAAGLYGQVRANFNQPSVDGLTASQQLHRINSFVADLVAEQQARWRVLRQEMAASSIQLVEPAELGEKDREWLGDWFMAQAFPVLTPLNVDPAHPFPFINNKDLTLAIAMTAPDGKDMNGLIPIPAKLDRFIRLPCIPGNRTIRFIRLEMVISMFLSELFPTMRIRAQGAFRVVRDS
ncbi:MAG: polyphosphate kinase, component of degradosome, partial [Pseudomonadota bacterium]